MYRRNNMEEVVLEETKVWECASDACKGWIRDNFTSNDEHKCPLCGSEMIAGTKCFKPLIIQDTIKLTKAQVHGTCAFLLAGCLPLFLYV